jgi:hypothetical protein
LVTSWVATPKYRTGLEVLCFIREHRGLRLYVCHRTSPRAKQPPPPPARARGEEGLQSNSRPALQSAARLARAAKCKTPHCFSTPSSSTTTSQLQQLHGSFLGGKHLMPTSLIAHTRTHNSAALRLVPSIPHSLGGEVTRAPRRGTGGCRHAPGDPVVRLRCRLAPGLLTSCNLLMYGAPCAASLPRSQA